MYRPNPLNEKLQADGVVHGCWLHMASPVAAEVVALAGYDFVLIDHEHGPGHYLDATGLLQAISATSAASILRVPWNDAVHLKRALDIGVDGVLIPTIGNAEEAKRAADACRYPPGGTRGMAHVLCRASDYGLHAEAYAKDVEKNLMVILMIETLQGVKNVGEIAAVEGVDALFIGPFDLSCSLGKPGALEDPAFRTLLHETESAIGESGKLMGTIATGVDNAAALRERGYRFIVTNSDVLLLRDAALNDVAANNQPA